MNSRPSHSLSIARSYWDACTQVRYNVLADRAWSRPSFVARPMAHPWFGKLQPILVVSPSRLLVAAGSTLYSYRFTRPSGSDCAPGVQFEISFTLTGLGT